MYDSRSDHPFKGVHHHRSWADKATGGFKYVDGYWQPSRNRTLSKRAAIAEGLAEMLTVEPVHGPGLKRLGLPHRDLYTEAIREDYERDAERHAAREDYPEYQRQQILGHLTPDMPARMSAGYLPMTHSKRSRAKQPFSRLTDGTRHPVTIRTTNA